MPAVWYIGQASKRTVSENDWAAVGIVGRPSVIWEAANGWSVPQQQFTNNQLALLNSDPLFVIGAPDGPRIGMPQGVDYQDKALKGWVIEQILQRVGMGATSPSAPSTGTGTGDGNPGLPTGGDAGDVLVKGTARDFDATWQPPETGGGTMIPVYESGGKYVRPAGGTDICVIFTGVSDPGSVALENDRWERLA